MALSGSLRDFDLSYIFQIIAHEGKTGRLTLSAPGRTGMAIFRNGQVVSATEGTKSVPAMLTQYLIEVKGVPESEVSEIHGKYGSSLRRLASEYMSRQFVSDHELSSIVALGVEDLACSLFLWDEGNYSFEVLADVADYQAENIAVAYENVTMEAARRLDEFKRMRESIRAESVFIRADQAYTPDPVPVSPFDDLVEYLHTRIDGTSPVSYLCRTPFASEYRVYEALTQLVEEGRVTALSEKLSRSINAALHREDGRGRIESVASDALLSVMATLAVVLATLFLSVVIVRGNLLADSAKETRARRQAALVEWRQTKTRTGQLWYDLRHPDTAATVARLLDDGLVGSRDINPTALPVLPAN